MARTIDAGAVKRRAWDIAEAWKDQGRDYEALLLESVVEQIVDTQPTLTPPNEPPPCYQPDGDGCAYQCYDGDDEPIDKCKECPLCYSDKQRHHTPPNEPLTLEQLREMDGEPVWVTPLGFWALVISKRGQRVQLMCSDGETVWADKEIELVGPVYRRPPEGGADA